MNQTVNPLTLVFCETYLIFKLAEPASLLGRLKSILTRTKPSDAVAWLSNCNTPVSGVIYGENIFITQRTLEFMLAGSPGAMDKLPTLLNEIISSQDHETSYSHLLTNEEIKSGLVPLETLLICSYALGSSLGIVWTCYLLDTLEDALARRTRKEIRSLKHKGYDMCTVTTAIQAERQNLDDFIKSHKNQPFPERPLLVLCHGTFSIGSELGLSYFRHSTVRTEPQNVIGEPMREVRTVRGRVVEYIRNTLTLLARHKAAKLDLSSEIVYRTASTAQGSPDVFPLIWTGKNSPNARNWGSNLLVRCLSNLDSSIPTYIFGHSHGGSVAVEALSRLTREARILSFGTPYLTARNIGAKPQILEPLLSVGALPLAYLVVADCLILWTHYNMGPQDAKELAGGLMVFAGLCLVVGNQIAGVFGKELIDFDIGYQPQSSSTTVTVQNRSSHVKVSIYTTSLDEVGIFFGICRFLKIAATLCALIVSLWISWMLVVWFFGASSISKIGWHHTQIYWIVGVAMFALYNGYFVFQLSFSIERIVRSFVSWGMFGTIIEHDIRKIPIDGPCIVEHVRMHVKLRNLALGMLGAVRLQFSSVAHSEVLLDRELFFKLLAKLYCQQLDFKNTEK